MTSNQIRALSFIATEIAKTGKNPTKRAIAEALGITCLTQVRGLVGSLVFADYLTPRDPKTGAYALTGKPLPDGARPANFPVPKQTIRACLMCRASMASNWAGERICPSCKTTQCWKDGAYFTEMEVRR